MKYKVAIKVTEDSESNDAGRRLQADIEKTLDQLNQIGAKVTHVIVCADDPSESNEESP